MASDEIERFRREIIGVLEADNHLQEEADGTPGHGAVEIFGGDGMRR
jgi:hypothetical protein